MAASPSSAPPSCRTKAHNIAVNQRYVERLLKYLLWQKGGYRVTIAGRTAHRRIPPRRLLARGRARLRLRVHGRPRLRPPDDDRERALRRLPRGARIRRAARPSPGRLPHRLRPRRQRSQVRRRDRWQGRLQRRSAPGTRPYKADPQYHYDGVHDSLRRAAAHLPRVDAIGGSAAGVYVANEVRVGSLYRAVPQRPIRHAHPPPLLRSAKPPGTASRSTW